MNIRHEPAAHNQPVQPATLIGFEEGPKSSRIAVGADNTRNTEVRKKVIAIPRRSRIG